jgi:hypothetical protein
MGRPRLYLIVADDEGELYYNADESPCVRPARTARGLVRLRAEIPAYHYLLGSSGVEAQYPEKRFDDAIDPLRAIADRFFPRSAPMTDAEKFEARLPDHLKKEAYAEMTFEDRHRADQARQPALPPTTGPPAAGECLRWTLQTSDQKKIAAYRKICIRICVESVYTLQGVVRRWQSR